MRRCFCGVWSGVTGVVSETRRGLTCALHPARVHRSASSAHFQGLLSMPGRLDCVGSSSSQRDRFVSRTVTRRPGFSHIVSQSCCLGISQTAPVRRFGTWRGRFLLSPKPDPAIEEGCEWRGRHFGSPDPHRVITAADKPPRHLWGIHVSLSLTGAPIEGALPAYGSGCLTNRPKRCCPTLPRDERGC